MFIFWIGCFLLLWGNGGAKKTPTLWEILDYDMKDKLFRSIFVLSFSVFVGCSDSDDMENGTAFYWEQTGCADPWGTRPNDSNKKISAALQTYLKGKGISESHVVGFENTLKVGESTCYACHCPTGTLIYVEVPHGDGAKMEELGFKRK